MAKVTLVFAVLLIALGLVGFFGTGSTHYTALIPAWIGLALGICGHSGHQSRRESRRKLFMHINVTIGLVGFLGTVAEIIRSMRLLKPLDTDGNGRARLALAWLLFIYVGPLRALLHRRARRSGKV